MRPQALDDLAIAVRNAGAESLDVAIAGAGGGTLRERAVADQRERAHRNGRGRYKYHPGTMPHPESPLIKLTQVSLLTAFPSGPPAYLPLHANTSRTRKWILGVRLGGMERCAQPQRRAHCSAIAPAS